MYFMTHHLSISFYIVQYNIGRTKAFRYINCKSSSIAYKNTTKLASFSTSLMMFYYVNYVVHLFILTRTFFTLPISSLFEGNTNDRFVTFVRKIPAEGNANV